MSVAGLLTFAVGLTICRLGGGLVVSRYIDDRIFGAAFLAMGAFFCVAALVWGRT